MYPYEDIAKYLNLLKEGRGKYNCSVEWDYIHETFTAQQHQDETGIHIADLTASALHKALELKQHSMTDDRFERNLFPILYRKPISQARALLRNQAFPAQRNEVSSGEGKVRIYEAYSITVVRPPRSTLAGALHRADSAH